MAPSDGALITAAFQALHLPTVIVSENHVVTVSNHAAQLYFAPYLIDPDRGTGSTEVEDLNALEGLCVADLPIRIDQEGSTAADIDTWLDALRVPSKKARGLISGEGQQTAQVKLETRRGTRQSRGNNRSREQQRATLTAVIWTHQSQRNYTLTFSAPQSSPKESHASASDRKSGRPELRSEGLQSNGFETIPRTVRPGFSRAASSLASVQGNRPFAFRTNTATSLLKEKDARNVSWEKQAASPIRQNSLTSSLSLQTDSDPEAVNEDTFALFRDAIFYTTERPGFILSADFQFGKLTTSKLAFFRGVDAHSAQLVPADVVLTLLHLCWRADITL